MAKAAQVVLLENEYYLIKAPNGKVLEVKNFNTETALRSVFGIMQATPGSSGSSWTPGTDAGGSKTALLAR